MTSTQTHNLLTNATASGSNVTVDGGTYLWSTVGTFSSATITLQAMLPDLSTFITVATHTVATSTQVTIGAGTVVKATISGSPTGIYSQLKRIPQE